MQQSIATQVIVFVYSLALGVVLGIMYDVFRIIRMIINSKYIAIFIQDVLYFILGGVITFLFVLGVNSGNSRFYILAGEGIGWIVYHITLGELIYKCSNKIVTKLKDKIKAIKCKICKKSSKCDGEIEQNIKWYL